MPAFMCPFCGQNMSINDATLSRSCITFGNSYQVYDDTPVYKHLEIRIYRCPNSSCKKETIFANGFNGYIEDRRIQIWPESTAKQYPEYIPSQIRSDYEEACAIADRSPKASATLSRRCIQGMIRDFWGIQRNRLVDEIEALKDRVPASQWAAIDAIRKVGNIGAHMEKDVNLIVDVTTEEAQTLISMIELLMDKWYISRNDEEQLLKRVISISEQKSIVKHQ